MKRGYRFLLVLLMLAPTLAAQQVDTVIIYRRAPLPPHAIPLPPPGAEMDAPFVHFRGEGDVVYHLRRHRGHPDSVYAYIRRLPGERRAFALLADSLRLHADSLRFFADSLWRGTGRFRFDADSLMERARLFARDSTMRFFGRMDRVPFPDAAVWRDSLGERHLFRLELDSLRRTLPRHLFEGRPGARVERWNGDVDVWRDGDSTVVRLHRVGPTGSPGHPGRIVIPRGLHPQFEQRGDGVLVVPDGKGGTWIYVPPKEEGEE